MFEDTVNFLIAKKSCAVVSSALMGLGVAQRKPVNENAIEP